MPTAGGYAESMLRHLIYIAIAMLLIPAAAAGTYKWVDKDGNVHYSDTPVKGATEIDLPQPTTFDAPELPPAPVPETAEPEPDAVEYTEFEFISPKQDQVFWNVGGRIPVQLALEPALQAGDEVQLYFNGARVAMDGLGTTLTEVYRGAYTIRAVIVGPDGSERIATPPVVFHVKQTSIANPR